MSNKIVAFSADWISHEVEVDIKKNKTCEAKKKRRKKLFVKMTILIFLLLSLSKEQSQNCCHQPIKDKVYIAFDPYNKFNLAVQMKTRMNRAKL